MDSSSPKASPEPQANRSPLSRLVGLLLVALTAALAGYAIDLQQTTTTQAGKFSTAVITTLTIAGILAVSVVIAALFRKPQKSSAATIPERRGAHAQAHRYFKTRWRSPLLWVGAFIPTLVYLSALLHSRFPAIPLIDLRLNVQSISNALDSLPLYMTQSRIYFAAVGLACLLPSDIAFSLWFFPLLNGLLQMPSVPAGHHLSRQYYCFSVALLTAALLIARTLWSAWPLHPIGLVLMNTPLLQTLWLSIAIGWASKLLLLRAGGRGALRLAFPFFIGLILGETVWLLMTVAMYGTSNFPLPAAQ